MNAASLAILALLPLLGAADVCLSPKVQSEVYTTSEAAMSTSTVVVIEFSISCKNGLKELSLFADFNGRAFPASKLEGTTNRYQVSFTGPHKSIPSGSYEVKFYDEDQYSDLRKAQRSGEGMGQVKSLFSVSVSHPGASKGPYVQSEFLIAAVGSLVWWFAYSAKSRLQAN